MNKVQEILMSYMTKYTATEEQKKLASERLETCTKCEFWVQSAIRDYCSKCGCTTSGKVFSPKGSEACPEKRWIN